MKKILSLLSLAALTIGLLGSCSKIDERISNLEKRIDGIESNQIASIKSQVDAINTSIADLGTIRQNVQTLMNTVPSKEDIEELRRADEALGRRIDELKSYTDDELKKYATIEWVKATFATLDQHQWTCDTIAKIDARIGALDANLSQSISGLESSLKQWVNEQLDAYYTAAQMDAKLDVMRNDINNAKAQGKTATDKADSLATELTTLKTAVDSAKANIRSEYKVAVQSAIETSEGKLSQALKDSIAEVNNKITALGTRVTTLEGKVLALEGKVDKLLAMVQSVTIVPVYTDGSVESTKDGVLYLDIIVSPAQAVATLTKDSLKVLVNEVKTRAVDVDTVAVTKFKADAANGTITARADISSNLPVASGKALTIAVNVRNGISDYTTEFYPVTLSSELNVTVNDETDTTKVTIKADEDFLKSIIGNIEVDKLAEAKPTSITVGGIGNVIFDKTATAKIKTNAAEVQATSVVFKVEDVTTTKPVPNADVVLEVTMKAVDKTGTEVFCDRNAEGEVTIQIPMDENVVYVNSVKLVDENDNPIQGGVVPDSEKIENGKLIFKVNHFSKYAIDYVTTAEYKAVTGVIIEPNSITLEVGDTYSLAAVIDPEDATNKKVTWSSSDTTKVKVDDTGKITAVAFGQATITATTKDGGKTATCTVKVTETKTMADILGTNTGIPESEDMTPPAKAWVNSTDPTCKAFIGKDGEAKYFVILKEGQPSASLKLRMNDAFTRIDDNIYQRIVPSVGTFTIKMTEGKFTSYEFTAASGSAYDALNGTYSAPVPNYVEIAAKYDGSTVATLKWYRQNLAITGSGKKAWTDDSGSPVKVPGTGEYVVVGDYFQWGTFAGFYGSGADSDKGLLPYSSFTNTGCGDGSNAFTFKDGKQFNEANAPYYSGSAYTKYNATDGKTTLEASDDVASIILGGTWRMPTKDEIKAMKEATYWAWDAKDKGYYVYAPNPATDAGKVNNGTGTYNKADALLFFPATGYGDGTSMSNAGTYGYYRSSTLCSGNTGCAYRQFFNDTNVYTDNYTHRRCGISVRPVQDPAATYVAVTSVSLNETSKNITVGGNLQLTATVIPDDATQQGVYWASDKPAVATVDPYGNVTGVAAGTATITATTVDGSKTATCVVTVKAEIKTIADVLATVEGGFPISTGTKWTNGCGMTAYIYGTDLILQNQKIALSTSVTKGENCYTASVNTQSTTGTLTFNMKDGILTNFEYKATEGSSTSWDGKYVASIALPGVFSVSDTKKVHFSRGNLWYGKVGNVTGFKWNFETEQYSISSSWDENHVSNFYWSKTASVACAESYNESGTSASDVLFTNATDFTVNGQKNVWRTLSHDEWKYLFEHHTYKYAQVNGKYGIVIAPDGFSGTIADSYSITDWATAESNGFVFLPNTGFRYYNNGTSISETDKSCFYWTSTASGLNGDNNPTAYRMFFQWNGSSLASEFDNNGERQWAIGIRLVTE